VFGALGPTLARSTPTLALGMPTQFIMVIYQANRFQKQF
jgi:hypothetical protein